jgi:hypothetical protein
MRMAEHRRGAQVVGGASWGNKGKTELKESTGDVLCFASTNRALVVQGEGGGIPMLAQEQLPTRTQQRAT